MISKYNQPSREVIDDKGNYLLVTCPPMVAFLKSAPPEHYQEQGLNPEWARQIKIIGSKLLIHSDFAEASHSHWVAGCTIYQLSMPHVNLSHDESVIGYWKSGKEIRAADIRKYNLDTSKFDRLTRAGYNTLCVQVIHLNSSYASERNIARKALRVLYAYGASQGASIVCGDFNGAGNRASTGPQVNLTETEQISNHLWRWSNSNFWWTL